MFKVLSLLVAVYTCHCVVAGEVYVKSGVWGRTVRRANAPQTFWLTIVLYAGLAVALATVF